MRVRPEAGHAGCLPYALKIQMQMIKSFPNMDKILKQGTYDLITNG